MRKLPFLLLVLFLALNLSSVAFAQEDEESKPKFVYTVKGRIVDADGKPVPDANIYFESEKGHYGCVIIVSGSDENGNFIIQKTTSEENPIWIIASEKVSPERVASLSVSSYAGMWGVTDYYPEIKGKKLELRANQVTDLGDIPLTLSYQPVSFILRDASGEKIKAVEESDADVFFELLSPNGDKLADHYRSIKNDKDEVSIFEFAIPQGVWNIRVRIYGDYDLEGMIDLDVKASEKQEVDVTLKKSGEENDLSNSLKFNRAEALKELERRKIEISEESLLKRIDKGNLHAVELLLAAGVNPNAKNEEGNSILYYAIDNNETEIAHALIIYGADINEKDKYEETVLMQAAFKGNVEIVKELINRDAEVNGRSITGRTPLMNAAWSDSPETINALIDAGAEVNAKDIIKRTALMFARQNSEVTETLLLRGAKVNAKDKDGQTALLYQFDGGDQSLKVIDVLLKYGANPNVKNKKGNTPLMDAAASNDTDIVELLKSYGAKDTKETLLMLAVLDNDVKQVRELLKRGADPNSSSQEGWTPLLRAAQDKNLEIIRMLLDKGANINAKLKDGETPLRIALSDKPDIEVMKFLLSKGADINAKDKDGETVLLYAIRFKPEFVKFLIDNGADVNIKDKDGWTPLKIARLHENKDAILLLKKAGAE